MLSSFFQPKAGQTHYENLCMKAVNQSIGECKLTFSYRYIYRSEMCDSDGLLGNLPYSSGRVISALFGFSAGIILMMLTLCFKTKTQLTYLVKFSYTWNRFIRFSFRVPGQCTWLHCFWRDDSDHMVGMTRKPNCAVLAIWREIFTTGLACVSVGKLALKPRPCF